MARLAVLSTLVACGGHSDAPHVALRHPIPDSLLSASTGVAAREVEDTTSSPFATLLAERSTDVRYGLATGDDREVLGEVLDGVILPDGRAALLDGSHGFVRLYDGGVVEAPIGGLGEGPGFFTEPTTLFVRADSLVVLDLARAVHVLASPRESASAWVRTTRLAFEAEDACFVGETMIALAPPALYEEGAAPRFLPDAGVLHRLDADGQRLESFHVPYRTSSRVIAQSFASGKLLCDAADESITVALSNLGEVHRVAASGEVRWITRLPGYSAIPLEERSSGTVGPAREFRAPVDRIRNIARVTDSLLVVSITSTAMFEPGRPRTHRLAVLRRRDGAFLGHVADERIAAVLYGSATEALVYRDLPHPEVTRVRFDTTTALEPQIR